MRTKLLLNLILVFLTASGIAMGQVNTLRISPPSSSSSAATANQDIASLFEGLPSDMCAYIAGFVDAKGLCHLRALCRRTKALADDHPLFADARLEVKILRSIYLIEKRLKSDVTLLRCNQYYKNYGARVDAQQRHINSIARRIITGIKFGVLDLACSDVSTLELNEILKALINEGLHRYIKTLWLTRNSLKILPDTIWQFTWLKKLYLSNNDLESLSDFIKQLEQLEVLDLSNNKLKSLSSDIGRLNQLNDLDLSHNKLESLPNSIGDLVSLKWLKLSYNNLISLPDTIGRLAQLTLLSLYGNPITEQTMVDIKAALSASTEVL